MLFAAEDPRFAQLSAALSHAQTYPDVAAAIRMATKNPDTAAAFDTVATALYNAATRTDNPAIAANLNSTAAIFERAAQQAAANPALLNTLRDVVRASSARRPTAAGPAVPRKVTPAPRRKTPASAAAPRKTASAPAAAPRMGAPAKTIFFYERDERYYEFANLFKIPGGINIDGQNWKTSEQYFQAQKFVATSPVTYQEILASSGGRDTFDIANPKDKPKPPVRKDWHSPIFWR